MRRVALACAGAFMVGMIIHTPADAYVDTLGTRAPSPAWMAQSDAAHLVRKARTSRAKVRKLVLNGSPAQSKAWARNQVGADQFGCLEPLWEHESGWTTDSYDPGQGDAMAGGVRKTWGIPQANPGTKMAAFGDDWRTNPITQMRWGLHYIDKVYGSPCEAWDFWQSNHWY